MLEFENIHCHTMISNVIAGFPDSPVGIEAYAKEYVKRGMHCLVASEHGYRGDVWAQADAAKKYSTEQCRLKPICAAEVYFVPDRNPELKDGRNFHLLLLAKNNDGFRQMNLMLSESQMSGYYYHGRVDFDLLSKLDYRNFICTTACIGGIFKDECGSDYADTLHEIFRENFFLEVQHHPNVKQAEHNAKILECYKKNGWPLIFGADTHYVFPEEKILRKELQLSSRIDMDDSDWDLHLPTPEEAYRCFVEQGVLNRSCIEEAFENTLIVRDFEGFSYTTERKLPISKPRQNLNQDQRNKLYKKLVCEGYIAKAGMPTPEEAKELHAEMDTITETNTSDYFLAHKDMLERGIELGGVLTTTARGSAGSFASNYALGFTTINRLHFPIHFFPSRFISKDKLKAGMPDIDLNLTNVEAFEQAGKEMFGEYGCLPMIAYGKNKTSSAFKMLARARNLDFELSNAISKQLQQYELDKKHAIENNSDDEDYDVDEHVLLKEYVSPEYLELVEDSKQYQGIIVSVSPHPCGHTIYHKDLREEIGLIRLKAKSGSKEPKLCVFIDGVTADHLNYVKADLLRVDVVKLIAESFKAAGQKVMPVNELLDICQGDTKIWSLYWKGFTQCLNQCERPASTEKCMQFKPQNIVELSSFIAAIRPGFKSMLQTFLSRTTFTYGIKSLDELLKIDGMTGNSANCSYLLFDEQILRILIAGGIDPARSYATIKHIKKKHQDKVLEVKQDFKTGFTAYLKEKENATEEQAADVVEKIWKIIEDSSSYLFCAAHSAAMGCDSLYCAYLKAYYPYEFYSTALQLYSAKGNKDKIALLIDEMKRYAGIHMTSGLFGSDNRNWLCDKENHTISQDLCSIKFISKRAASDLYEAAKQTYSSFTDLLWHLLTKTCLDTRQIEILIRLGYFAMFGKSEKLLTVYNEFFNGKNRLTKTLKSYEQRLQILREFEKTLPDKDLPLENRVSAEFEYMGLCLSSDKYLKGRYLITEVDDKYGIKLKLYGLAKGNNVPVRMKKDIYAALKPKPGMIVKLSTNNYKEVPKRIYTRGMATKSNETEYWLTGYSEIKVA